jgi:hypothetical protein
VPMVFKLALLYSAWYHQRQVRATDLVGVPPTLAY